MDKNGNTVQEAEGQLEMNFTPEQAVKKSIQPGDTVRIAPDAVYYTGKQMPDWVKKDVWIVKSIAGDRAVIDKNVSGTSAICSPVHVRYLVAGAASDNKAGQAPASCQPKLQENTIQQEIKKPSCDGKMNVSKKGVELVAKYEGCRLAAYKCPAGIWTIGYGHTMGVKPGDTLPSNEAAKALLKKDLKKYGNYVNQCRQKGLISFPLNQNQFDALTSFTYNCGNGSLQKLVSGRNAATIADKLLLYNKGGGRVLPGLEKRRKEERELFLS